MDDSRRRRRLHETQCVGANQKLRRGVHLEAPTVDALEGEKVELQPHCTSGFPAECDSFLDAALSVLEMMSRECEQMLAGSDSSVSAMLDETLAAFEHVSDICANAGVLPHQLGDEQSLETLFEWQRKSASTASSPCFELDQSDCCNNTRRRRCRHDSPTQVIVVDEGDHQSQCRASSDNSLNSSCAEDDAEMQPAAEELECPCVPRRGTQLEAGLDILFELDTLRTQVGRSDCTVVEIKHQLSATCERIEQLESTMHETKKAVERTAQDQARHWRAICDELVQDKRGLATQLAEERGRFAALKRHLDAHSDALQLLQTRPSTPTSETSTDAGGELPCSHRSQSPLATSTQSSTRLSRRHDDSDPNRERRPLSDERLPGFRRNYLSSSRPSR